LKRTLVPVNCPVVLPGLAQVAPAATGRPPNFHASAPRPSRRSMTALGFARGRSFRRRLRETASSLEITAGHQRQSPLPLERWRAGIGTGTRVEGLEPSTAGFGARKRPRRPDLCFVLPTPRRERGHQRRSRQPIAGAGRVAGSTDPRELLIPPIRGASSLRSMAF
jgi:hypothetical protein